MNMLAKSLASMLVDSLISILAKSLVNMMPESLVNMLNESQVNMWAESLANMLAKSLGPTSVPLSKVFTWRVNLLGLLTLFVPQACNLIKKETLAQVSCCEFFEIFKNTFFTEHLRTTASETRIFWRDIERHQWHKMGWFN